MIEALIPWILLALIALAWVYEKVCHYYHYRESYDFNCGCEEAGWPVTKDDEGNCDVCGGKVVCEGDICMRSDRH